MQDVIGQENPVGIQFQAIARDHFSNPAKDRKIYIQSNIIQSRIDGKIVMSEKFITTTDGAGIFNIGVGTGIKAEGSQPDLKSIEWAKGPYYLNLKIAIEPIAPTNDWDYTKELIDLGTAPFGTVPYALYASNNSNPTLDTATMLAPYLRRNELPAIPNTPTTVSIKSYKELIDTPQLFNGDYNLLNNKPILFSGAYSDLIGKPSLFDGNYNSLTNKPTLFNGDYTLLSNKPVLFSGAYSDLTGKPNLFDGNYNSLGNRPILFSGSYSDLTGKPSLFDGDYNTLSNKPTLFDGNYNTLTNKPTLFTGIYSDLIAKPTLFDGDYYTLNNRPILFSGDYNALTNKPVLSLTGDITSVGSATTLSISGVASGTYGSALAIPTITVDAKGRIIAASSTSITPNNFPNKTNAEKNAMPVSTATGTVIWCSDCGTRGQLQVYNGTEWTDLTGGTAASSGIVLTTLNLSAITSTSASAAAGVSSDGGVAITAKGVVWSTSVNPTIALTTKTNDGTGIGAFTSSINSLSTSTLYYVRAYATNANGTVYGAQQSFTTLGAVPTLSTTSATAISLTAATTGGNITSDGGTTITNRGICWSTSPNPSISDNKLVNGNGTGSFTSNLVGLDGGTTYYVRAYATNAVGTGYGAQISFSTSTLAAGVAYLGGKVAYIFQSGDAGYVAGQTHGFIIMNHPMGMQVLFTTSSSSYVNSSMNFGTGRNNTQLLYNAAGLSATAAKSMYQVMYDGYNDWYIPSYAEWNKIALGWSNLGIADGIYQSSSEQSSSYFYTIQFYNSGSSYQSRGDSKSSPYGVIGIRNF